MTVHVASVGFARFGKRAEGLVELGAEAAGPALDGVGRKPIDLLVVGTMLAHGARGAEPLLPRLAGRLGLETAAGYRVEATSASGAMAFHTAVGWIESGRHARALVIAAEKMTDRPTAEVTGELTAALHPSEVAQGATMPGLAALVTQRYLERYSLDPAVLDPVSVQARRMAEANPYAHFQKAVTREEVAASPPVALPLRRLHCSPLSDGAVAVVLEKGDGPASVLGIGQGFAPLRLVDRPDLTTFAATRVAARSAYEGAHITRKELEVVETHDAFAPLAMIHLEDLGVCGPGEGPAWYENGWVGRDGRLPVNPSGGLLGRGHPVGASGLAGIGELALQLRGEAGTRAVARAPRLGLAQSMAGLGTQSFVTVLGRSGA
jgi:acetyl-CoA C-acetyltransferase